MFHIEILLTVFRKMSETGKSFGKAKSAHTLPEGNPNLQVKINISRRSTREISPQAKGLLANYGNDVRPNAGGSP